jgi:hypothetical protein
MAYTVTIAGVDRTDYVRVNSGKITRDINGRATCNIDLRQRYRSYAPVKGSSIVVAKSGTTKFAGNIARIVKEQVADGPGLLSFELECLDYNHIAERRVFSGQLGGGQTLYAIVAAVVTTGLSNEGITIAGISPGAPGPTINEDLNFNLESVKSIFDRLSTITGYLWNISFSKVLTFSLFSSNPAPFGLTDSSDNYFDLETEDSDELYRNRQHVRSETQIATTRSESYTVVQNGQDFIPTSVGPDTLLTVTVNGASKTISLHTPGVAPSVGFDFYYSTTCMGIYTYGWAVGNPALGLTLNAGDVVAFTYIGATNNSIMVEDTAEQTARAALEGGSGIHEAVEEQRYLQTLETLQAVGNGRLRQFGADVLKISFSTRTDGLVPGHRISIQNTLMGLNATYLIERVETLIAEAPYEYHRIQCTSVEPVGPVQSTYQEKVTEMARIGNPDIASLADRVLTFVVGDDPLGLTADATDNHPECVLESVDRIWRPYAWSANCKTAPAGASLNWNADYSLDKGTWTQFASGSISGSSYGGDGTVTAVDIPAGAWFRLDITQVGSSTPGAGLTVQIRGQEI